MRASIDQLNGQDVSNRADIPIYSIKRIRTGVVRPDLQRQVKLSGNIPIYSIRRIRTEKKVA